MSNDELTLIKEIELLRIDIAYKNKEYKQKCRLLLWYASVVGVILLITVLGFIGAGSFGNLYFSGWTGFITFLFGIIFLGLVVYFLLDYQGWGKKHGFRGLARLKELVSLREDIDDLQTNIETKEKLLASLLSASFVIKCQYVFVFEKFMKFFPGWLGYIAVEEFNQIQYI